MYKSTRCIHEWFVQTLFVFVALFSMEPLYAADRYVSLAGGHVAPYTSWVNAATTIQAAVDACVDGDTVFVTNGVYDAGCYAWDHTYSNAYTSTVFTVYARIMVTNDIAIQSINGPASTIVMGEGPSGDGAVRCAYLDGDIQLSGFTLANGHTYSLAISNWCPDPELPFFRGGGLLCYGSVVISNCLITENEAIYGGGISGGTVIDSVIQCNTAYAPLWWGPHLGKGGGAIDCYLQNCQIISNTAHACGGGAVDSIVKGGLVQGNKAHSVYWYPHMCTLRYTAGKGGGLYRCRASNVRIVNNISGHYGGGVADCMVRFSTISENSAVYECNSCVKESIMGQGGGVYGGVIENCMISSNTAGNQGGGAAGAVLHNCVVRDNDVAGYLQYDGVASYLNEMYGQGGGVASCRVVNCTAIENNAEVSGGGAYQSDLYNSIFMYNSGYSCSVVDSFSTNCWFREPKFVGMKNLRLMPDSPCINAGNNDHVAGRKDLDRHPRITDGRVDIGAYEFNSEMATGMLEVVVHTPKIRLFSRFPVHLGVQIDGHVLGCLWTWGDGSFDYNSYMGSHSYALSGTYQVTFYAWNSTQVVSVPVWLNILEEDERYVSLSGGHIYPYDSWEKAATNINAIERMNGKHGHDLVVWVTNGHYRLDSCVEIVRPPLIQSVNGPEVTVIDGQDAVRCIHLRNSDAVIRGFSITGGKEHHGAGILAENGIIEDCIIYANHATNDSEFWSHSGRTIFPGYGGGIRMCKGTIRNCTIRDNKAGGGGGLYLEAGVLVENCRIVSNTVDVVGGAGISCSNAMIENCEISGNAGGYYGGGVWCVDTGLVENCTIVGNETERFGGGFFCSNRCMVRNCLVSGNKAGSGAGGHQANGTLENCTVVGNQSTNVCGGVELCGSNDVVRNCIIVMNENVGDQAFRNILNASSTDASITYSLVQPLQDGVGNIEDDPRFVNDDRNYRLMPSSPCINAGQNQDWMNHLVDLDGNFRIHDMHVDMGAYEFNQAGPVCDFITETPCGMAPHAAVFTAYVAGVSTTNMVYQWDLDGDGIIDLSGGDLPVVTGRYVVAGRYDVVLEVQGDGTHTARQERFGYIVAAPETVFVSPAGVHESPYTNWSTASTSLQEAVSLCVDGCQIWVSNGLYELTSPVELHNEITVQSVNGYGVTIVTAVQHAACFNISHEQAIVDGFTITGGSARNGGGVQINYGGTLQNALVAGNMATGDGGGALCFLGGVISNCIFRDNQAANNGGGGCLEKGGSVYNSIFESNRADASGGGVFIGGEGTVSKCTFDANAAATNGGGIVLTRGGVAEDSLFCNNHARDGGGGHAHVGTMRRCRYEQNTANEGGGVYLGYYGVVEQGIAQSNHAEVGGGLYGFGRSKAGNMLLVHNHAWIGGGIYCDAKVDLEYLTVVCNDADYIGGGLCNYDWRSGPGSLRSSVFYGNQSGTNSTVYVGDKPFPIEYCCAPDLPEGSGNMEVDPQFADAANGDYRLLSTSPCIDAGNPSNRVFIDLDGVPRPLDGDGNGSAISDMGAYEYMLAAADSDRDGVNDGDECSVYGTNPTQSDSDGDGQSDRDEIVARMDPNDPGSFFAVRQMTAQQRGAYDLVLEWPTSVECNYTLYRCDSLAGDWTAVPGWIAMPGNGAMMSYTVPEGYELCGFYCVKSTLNQ